tara:strand:- start:1788 stop:2429 length:642 start_codon:yes stop_codon:yes gene_type:complete
MKHLKQFNQFLNEEALNETYLDKKSPAQIKKMHKLLKDAATLINDFLYYGNDEQQRHAKNIHGTGGMYKLMNSIDQFLNEGPVDRVVGGRPYEYIGDGRRGKAIVQGPMKDKEREEIIKRAKKAGYMAAPDIKGGVVILVESEINEVNSRKIGQIVMDMPYTFVGGGRNGKVIVDGPLKDDDRLEIVHRAKKAGYHAELNDEGDLVIDMDRRF